MATTYTLIASVTVGSGGAANIEFTSIPQTYTDLLIKFSCRTNGTGNGNAFYVYYNGSTSSYTRKSLYGNGISAVSSDGADAITGFVDGTTETASTFASTDIYIPNYVSGNFKSNSTDNVMENNASTAYQIINTVLWSNTSPITQITLTPPGVDSWVQYTTAYLYGISNA
jgi:hypothetical protein